MFAKHLLSSAALLALSAISSSADALEFSPVYLQLAVNRAAGSPVLDLPPQNQRPVLYAELMLGDAAVTTPTLATPRINESIYPDWVINTEQASVPLEPGHPVEAIVRIFDQDNQDEDDGVDDKVLLTAMQFDPFTCTATLGDQTIAGVWINSGNTCIISIPDLQSERGSAAMTLAAQWVGASPGN